MIGVFVVEETDEARGWGFEDQIFALSADHEGAGQRLSCAAVMERL